NFHTSRPFLSFFYDKILYAIALILYHTYSCILSVKKGIMQMTTKEFEITSDVGLHARPATLLVQEASRYASDIELEHEGKSVNVKLIMSVMSLGLSKGKTFKMVVDGHDAEEAMNGIEALFTKENIAK